MPNITGYQIFKQIYSGTRTTVYQGVREEDKTPVILKILQNEYPTPAELAKFKQEYQILENLNLSGIVKAYSLEQYRNSLALILEDLGGQSLSQYLRENTLSISQFLPLAIKLADTLGQLHQQQIIHQDIKPQNIIINPRNWQIKITDFSMATKLKSQEQTVGKIQQLEGTIAYMSPEQTGRMNRWVDYRTDFYSLGVTFYQMLTGKLPFESNDPMELVHCHLAKEPQLPQEINSEIPAILGAIIMKLLAKNAEDRYQNGFGLKADLEICQQQLESIGKIEEFSLGSQDVSSQLKIPQKLYGREEELAELLTAFERVCSGGTEVILVGGYSGIGKSALVGETQKPLVQYRGYFVSGKFDQFKRNIPYAAIIEAFSDLMGQILAESEEQIASWKDQLLTALGVNAQVIIDVIPEVELIVGKQPSVPELGATEAQNRFNLVFKKFGKCLSQKERPLVIFLDDLQWADAPSLKLIELLAGDGEIECLLLIGAYRDNEVDATHPLMLTVGEMEKAGATIKSLILEPLGLEDVKRLIADTLKCPSFSVDELAELLLGKTQGNPFFLTQLIESLFEEKLLSFDGSLGSWRWEIEEIEKVGITDNVVDLMVGKIQKLSSGTRDILKLAACIGNRFDLEMLAVVGEKSISAISNQLWEALEAGLIVSKSDALLAGEYYFLHDRVQQAAYSLIPDDEKQMTHYRIGQLLVREIPPEAREENIFEIVGQLNYGTALITEQQERDELAQLNLIACRKARTATAYQAGRQYASVGLSLLGENPWQRQYQMSFAFHEVSAELASLSGDFAAMERFVEKAIAGANSLIEQVNVYCIKIQAYISQNKLTEAIAIAIKFLENFGVAFPEIPTDKQVQQSMTEIEQLTGDKGMEDFVSLPEMTDAEQIAIVLVINSIMPAASISGSPLFPLLVALSVKLSMQYGNLSDSTYAYACYGLISCNLKQDVNTGVKFGDLALQVVSKLDAKTVKPKVLFIVALFIFHRKSHLKEILPFLQESYISGLEAGNLEFAGYGAHGFCCYSLLCGRSLSILERETHAYYNGLLQLNQLTTANWCRIYWQVILNLLGTTEHPSILSGEALQESEILPQLVEAGDFFGLYCFDLYKLMMCYLFGEMESAKSHAVEARRYLIAAAGTVGEATLYFYESLAILAEWGLHSKETSETLSRVEQNQRQLQQHWADYAPMNYQHKVDLVEAEKCRVLGQKVEAIELYDKAISGAKENEYIQEEALANELAAKFYLEWGKETIAEAYLTKAYYGYTRWGATAKVKQLETKYPYLKTPTSSGTIHATTIATSRSNANILDLTTVIKAGQTLAGEIKLDKLLEKLMKIAIENAGAQTGFLILKREENWLVRASATAEEVTVTNELPLNSQNLPLSTTIVNYVIRTRENLVLNDATNQGQFTRDAYILATKPKSILCAPLIHQNQLAGILYLENNLATGTFTAERLEVLKLLSSQIAISLENAQLYSELREFNQNLEKLVSDRTLELTQTLENLQATQNQLQEAQKLARLGNWEWDLITNELYWSDEIYRVFGLEKEPPETLFEKHEKQIHPEDFQFWQRALERLQKEGLPYDYDLRIIDDNGNVKYLYVQGQAAKDGEGKVIKLLGTAQDISDRKLAEKALKEKTSQLEQTLENLKATQNQLVESEKMAALGGLVAGVAHEINTPLGLGVTAASLLADKITAFVEIYKRGQMKRSDLEGFLNNTMQNSTMILSNLNRAADLIASFKQVAVDQTSEAQRSFKINDYLEETLLSLRSSLKKTSHQIEVNGDDGLTVNSYPGAFSQIVTNLVMNSLVHGYQDLEAGKLIFNFQQDGEKVIFEYADDGVGISSENLSKIFEPFFTTKRNEGGSGLGLHIVYNLVTQKLQGSIKCESQVGVGTKFFIKFPIQVQN